MHITGIICEYNPLHTGHFKQLQTVRAGNPDGGILCLMSGNYVQRGKPAIIDKSVRAAAAVACGADLVLELPVPVSLSSAEGFAFGGVKILSPFCHSLSFGAENADAQALMSTAQALLQPSFSEALQEELQKGLSFPAARQAALVKMGLSGDLVSSPNNILATEYCKAILAQNSPMQPKPILRSGSYHDTSPDADNPSATAVRKLMYEGGHWLNYVPVAAREHFRSASLHAMAQGERAVLARLRTMTDEEFEALPYGSEGLWRKLMKAARSQQTLADILTAVKSKRYTRTRLDRMVMCAFLGISQAHMDTPTPYVRVLALNDRGREILKLARRSGTFLNAGEVSDLPYQTLETRWGALYGLFSAASPETADAEARRRISYLPGSHPPEIAGMP